jgi:lipopolysaccharide transport system ATP-binding protein
MKRCGGTAFVTLESLHLLRLSAIIEVRGLGKQYALGEKRAAYGSLRESIMRAARGPFGRSEGTPPSQIWALKDVSFEVAPGEIVGIIGRNGAGKSTLLKILSRVTIPTTGAADLYGRVGSLLEIGTGFHPELTGRENIYLYGSILGMRHREIVGRFDEIVAFAEVERFIDTPVKHYSSGMYMRLAFAVAAHLEPEILMIDEVLAVGDAEFQRKCMGKMGDVARHGRTVLFVSHSLQAITALCTRCLYLVGGELRTSGNPGAVADAYLKDLGAARVPTVAGTAEGDEFRLRMIRLVGDKALFRTDEEIRVQVSGEVLKPLDGFVFGVEVWSGNQQFLAYSAWDDRLPPPLPVMPAGPFARELVIPAHTFGEGAYELRFSAHIHRRKTLLDPRDATVNFSVENLGGIGRRFQGSWRDVMRPAWDWREIP